MLDLRWMQSTMKRTSNIAIKWCIKFNVLVELFRIVSRVEKKKSENRHKKSNKQWNIHIISYLAIFSYIYFDLHDFFFVHTVEWEELTTQHRRTSNNIFLACFSVSFISISSRRVFFSFFFNFFTLQWTRRKMRNKMFIEVYLDSLLYEWKLLNFWLFYFIFDSSRCCLLHLAHSISSSRVYTDLKMMQKWNWSWTYDDEEKEED